MSDLYNAEIAGPYTALCGGNSDNDGSSESCMKIAPLDGVDGFSMGDTKLGDASPELRYSRDELVKGAHGILAMFGEDSSAAVA